MARRPKPEEHDNHERWLVSYADFITLLFAFFVVMYAISQVNEGKQKILSDALINAFKTIPTSSKLVDISQHGDIRTQAIQLPSVKRKEEAERAQQKKEMDALARQLKDVMAKPIEDGQIRITQTEHGIMVEISSNLLFPVGSATLDGRSIGVLTQLAEQFAKPDKLIKVSGYTDNVPINSPVFPSNWELSAARAGTVVRLFEATGVSSSKMVALGYGENRPLESNDTPEGRARNRRVTIEILAKNSEEMATLKSVKPSP
ncbi:flagellar motor protein MotD [Parachitinimonas caeni]|uniref:Flagellar motor protein MotD n=1 Tax=Parachitinimonas caeni TaxID=3031301 RepID=A0ABT7DZM0_9NEIS|nr:flagellar motor protein MotD [Parachitinimonas caeni]MDK2125512.1 flagellar motor protein MotD [Parachitinimonas caeni]